MIINVVGWHIKLEEVMIFKILLFVSFWSEGFLFTWLLVSLTFDKVVTIGKLLKCGHVVHIIQTSRYHCIKYWTYKNLTIHKKWPIIKIVYCIILHLLRTITYHICILRILNLNYQPSQFKELFNHSYKLYCKSVTNTILSKHGVI